VLGLYFCKCKISGRCMGLTTLPPSCADCLEIWEPQPPGAVRACSPRGLRRGPSVEDLLGSWVRIPPAAWMFVSCECLCCQVHVSATGRSLVQRSPTECGVSNLSVI
jgi:hypothetical protein